MNHFKYTGQFALKNITPIDQERSKLRKNSENELQCGNLRLSNNNLLKFKSKQYLLLLDGVIYEFDHELFSENQYSNLLEHFREDNEGTLRKINGEFVIIVVDLLSSVTWIATGESGNAALFYRKSGDFLHFSNTTNGLLQVGNGSNEVYFQRIYDILTGNHLGSGETCYSDIKRLMPGQYLKIKDGSFSIVEYSKLYSEERSRNKMADPLDSFREVFAHAVGHRLNADRIGIALSSGKDSTSVTAVTHKVYSAANQTLYGYCFRPSYLSDMLLSDIRYNETILLESFYRDYPAVLPREVEVKSGAILPSLQNSIRIYGEPVYGASNQFWIQKMQRMIHEDRCGVMFTGQGGNFTISWPPPELTSLRNNTIRNVYRRITSKQPALRLMDHSYMSRDFIHMINQDHFLNPFQRIRMDRLQPILIRNNVAYTGYLQKQVSLHYGFHVTDPTLDKDLIDFCLSIPYNVYHNKRGSRNLVIYGLKDLLPAEIRENRIRGIQGADINVRLHHEQDLILEKLMFINRNKLVTFVLETGSLVKDWKNFNLLSMNKKRLNHLLRIIQMGIFLSEIED